jgi:DUF4097 and DUF4098 domain-containing protein YvlB
MKNRQVLSLMAGLMWLLVMAWPAAAESRIEKNLQLQPNGQFILESDAGSVSVTGISRSGAHVVITSDRNDLNEEFDFNFDSGAGEARVTARRKHEGGWSHGVSLHFEVEVPAETRTQIRTGGGSVKASGLRGESNLKTSGGSIEVTGLDGNLVAHTSGGSIKVREVTGDARVETSGGPIEAEAIEGNLQAHTSGGGIQVERVTGYLEAKTSGGPIRATYSRGNKHGGELETSGGSIDVAIDSSANLELDASTSGGTVSTDLPIRVVGTISHSSLHGSLGSGGEALRLHTSGGSIHIRAL